MQDALTLSPRLRIDIYLDSEKIAPLADQEIQCQVHAYGCGMISDLGIAAGVDVAVRREPLSEAPYRVEMNGQPCRMPFRNWPSIQLTSMQCARELLDVLQANRELMIDPSVAQTIRAAWYSQESGNFLPGLDRKGFQRFLILLVRHGFRLNRGRAVGDTAAAMAQWTPEYCFEQSVRSMENLGIKLHGKQEDIASTAAGAESLAAMLTQLQEDLFYELGVRFPRVETITADSLARHHWQLQINDLRLPVFEGLGEAELLVNDTVERLKLIDIVAKPARHPANGNECAIVEQTDEVIDKCTKAGLTTWDHFGYMVLEVSARLRKHAACFVTLDTVEYDLDLLRDPFPALIESLRQRYTLEIISRIVKYLLDEEISVRNLRSMFEALLAIRTTIAEDLSKLIVFPPYHTLPCPALGVIDIGQLNPAHYGECVRMRLRRYISHKYTRGQMTLIVYLLDSAVESRLLQSAARPLTDQERQDVLEATFAEVGELPPLSLNPVILTTLEARRPLRELIEFEFPYLAVLSYQELLPEMNIQPIARIAVEDWNDNSD